MPAEGERPEIPSHLREGLPSAGKFEQDARRRYQIDSKRYQLRIPERSFRENGTVRHYVSVLRDVEAAEDRFHPTELAKHINMDTDLARQVGHARSLYTRERELLEHGFLRRADLDGIAWGLTWAVPDYHLIVDDGKFWSGRHPLQDPEAVQPAGIWRAAQFEDPPKEPWEKFVPGRAGWYWPDMANERHDPEHTRAIHEEAGGRGIPGDLASFDPATHLWLTALHYGRELVEATEQLDELPDAPGLTPSARERLVQVAPLNRLAVALLEEVHRPGQLTAERVAAELDQVVGRYGLVVRKMRGEGRT